MKTCASAAGTVPALKASRICCATSWTLGELLMTGSPGGRSEGGGSPTSPLFFPSPPRPFFWRLPSLPAAIKSGGQGGGGRGCGELRDWTESDRFGEPLAGAG